MQGALTRKKKQNASKRKKKTEEQALEEAILAKPKHTKVKKIRDQPLVVEEEKDPEVQKQEKEKHVMEADLTGGHEPFKPKRSPRKKSLVKREHLEEEKEEEPIYYGKGPSMVKEFSEFSQFEKSSRAAFKKEPKDPPPQPGSVTYECK